MENILNYIPKSERHDPETQLTPVIRVSRLNDGRSMAKRTISEAARQLPDHKDLNAESAYTIVQSLREARHDLWYEAIYNNRNEFWQTTGQESKVGEFFELILKTHDYNKAIADKTPDILFYDHENRVVALGDVAVSRAEANVSTIKHEKYLPIKTELERLGYTVVHEDFVVKEDLSNVNTLLQKYKNCHIIKHSFTGTAEALYTSSCNFIIREVLALCVDLPTFYKIEEKSQKTAAKLLDVEEIFHERYRVPVDEYVPIRQEDELIDMIKRETERLGGASYYDCSMDQIMDSFDSVIEANRGKQVSQPKSILKVCDNSQGYNNMTDHDLISDYVEDLIDEDQSSARDYLLSILPTIPQIKMMSNIKSQPKKSEIKYVKEYRDAKVGGKYQYKRSKDSTNPICINFEAQISKGSKRTKNPNEKKEPKTIDVDELNIFKSFVDVQIDYYGSQSGKPAFLNDEWDAYNKNEMDNTKTDREVYDFVKRTNGAQLCHSLSGLYSRITHMSTFQGEYDNIYCPPNGSFLAIMPNEHAPVNSHNCDMPFLFITRSPIGSPLQHVEYEYRLDGKNYIYYISKLCRLNVRIISCWENAGFRLVASATYLITKCTALCAIRKKVVGLLSMLIIDVHQKVSEYLDLLKYVSFMPFADLHRLPMLITDKCNLLMKTRMDAWMFLQIKAFILELGNKGKMNPSKPVLQTHNGQVTKESLGINVSLPSFIDSSVRHAKPTDFIEEISLVYTSRPKHLYGSQFLDESTTKTAEWNLEFDAEQVEHEGWTQGQGASDYPFDAKFCFSSDAIHYATKDLVATLRCSKSKMESDLYKSPYMDYLHTNCSLRGCTKDPSSRSSSRDIHTTSIDACFKYYKSINYNDKEARSVSVAQRFLESGDYMEFAMSEKDQRGGGRPIATPTLGAKALLMAVEKPEAVMGRYMVNNIIVSGKNKLQEQYEAYTSCASAGTRNDLHQIYQLTEDQTKYSENDNPLKYIPYIRTNNIMPNYVRNIQLAGVNNMMKRYHLVHRLPKTIRETLALQTEVIEDQVRTGVVARIGWPQGMYNYISTSVHCAADIWITKAYKIAYPQDVIHTKGLVHSDDSWVTVCCNGIDTFRRFSLFRTLAKRMFCLKINEKKLWGGRYLGELVSNYNLNGNVHLSTGKVIANGLSNLTYQNWPIDVSNQISTLQQAYRQGATIGTLIMLSTVLRQQIMSAYQVTGMQKALLSKLPIELGGYPSCSPFALAVCGTHAHCSDIHKMLTQYDEDQDHDAKRIVAAACMISVTKESVPGLAEDTINPDDYLAVELPERGEVFSAIKHLMPKSRKVAKALETIYDTIKHFPSDGLALIITKPNTLRESLGHYGELVSTKLFSLAAEHYTQSARRLAISQSMQAKGKVIKIGDNPPMTFNEAYTLLVNTDVGRAYHNTAVNAFAPHNGVVKACDSIVRTAILEPTNKKKGFVINRMPEVENMFRTIAPIQDVLLYIIDDKLSTKYFNTYSTNKASISTIKNDSVLLKERFKLYFGYFEVKRACQLIMQAKMTTLKERSWIQPKVSTETLTDFLEDLYGKTIHPEQNYKVHSDRSYNAQMHENTDAIQTVYGTMVLNSIYEGRFEITHLGRKRVSDVLNQVETANIDNNTRLKLAACQYVVNDNREYLDNYVKNEKFVSEWILPQQYINGKYVGRWEAIFLCANITCHIISHYKTVTIVTNKLDLRHILKGMRLFVSKCFSQSSYEYDSAWWSSSAWNCNTEREPNANAFLCSHNPYSTSIRKEPSEHFINLVVDESLCYPNMAEFLMPDRYVLTSNFRVINAVMTNVDGTENQHRVGNIFQSFSIPLSEQVVLKPAFIEGFLNMDLMGCKIMEDITLSRPVSLARSELLKLLDTSINMPMARTLWQTFVNVDRKTGGISGNLPGFDESQDEELEVVDLAVEEISSLAVAELAETTAVESLDSIAVEYEVQKVGGAWKLHRPKNFLRVLCSQLFVNVSQSNILDYIYMLLQDRNIYMWLQEMRSNIDLYDEIQFSVDAGMYVDYPKELFYFLYGKRLDISKTWDKVSSQTMTPGARDMRMASELQPIAAQTVVALDDCFFGNGEFTKQHTALDMLSR